LNVYVPDELAARARGLNVSAPTQAAIRAVLDDSATDAWLEELETSGSRVVHDSAFAGQALALKETSVLKDG